MKRYRMYVAVFAYLMSSNSNAEVDYMAMQKCDSDENADYEWSGHRCADADSALRIAADTMKSDKEPIIGVTPRRINRIYTMQSHFHTEEAALKWLESCKQSYSEHPIVGTKVNTYYFNEESLDEWEYNPVWRVSLEVKTTKRLDVEIDSAEYVDVEDGYDAMTKAQDLYNDGDLDHEVEYADVWDVECDAEDYEEI